MAYIKNPVQALSYSAFRPSPPKELIAKIIEFIKEEVRIHIEVSAAFIYDYLSLSH